eukprot:2184516-Rhodomonas_salina.1
MHTVAGRRLHEHNCTALGTDVACHAAGTANSNTRNRIPGTNCTENAAATIESPPIYGRFTRDWGRGNMKSSSVPPSELRVLSGCDTGVLRPAHPAAGVLTRLSFTTSADPQAPSRAVVCVGCAMSGSDRRVAARSGPFVHAVAKLVGRRVCGGV